MSDSDVRKIGNDIVSAIAGVGGALKHRLTPAQGAEGDQGESEERWLVVTIDRPVEEVAPGGHLPQPLVELGDRIEVELRPAPGDRGTELAARSREPVPSGVGAAAATIKGDDPRQAVRSALRQSKQLVEVGEVMRLDPAPHGSRPATPGGKLVELAASRSGGEGVL